MDLGSLSHAQAAPPGGLWHWPQQRRSQIWLNLPTVTTYQTFYISVKISNSGQARLCSITFEFIDGVQKNYKHLFLSFDFFFHFNQNVLLCLPHQATSVLHLLEPWIATILVTIVAVANVLRASHSHVLILTQPLELESGTQHFALQKAVAAKVSGGDRFVKMFLNSILKTFCHRCCNLTKLPWQLPEQP
mgnify:CR=1 FL=1